MSVSGSILPPPGHHVTRDGTRIISTGLVNNKPASTTTEEPLNVRFQAKRIEPSQLLRMEPRKYQVELCAKALAENVVIYLGTGLGKTYITVLFLGDPMIDQMIQSGRKVAFLAPTQDLIKQQAEYINSHVLYRVKIYCGRSARCGLHIDHWDRAAWNDELSRVDLLFMTPQIFLAAISTSLLRWDNFGAVIFDEVHHACRSKKKKPSGHPYMQILSSYKDYFSVSTNCTPKPRFVGLTASLINSMPKCRDDIIQEVFHLEKSLHGKCVTDIDVQDNRPTSIVHSYTSYPVDETNDFFCRMFRSFTEALDEALKIKKENQISFKRPSTLTEEEKRINAFCNRLRLAASGFSVKPGSFPKVIEGLYKIRQRCGLWMLRVVVYKLVVALERHCKNRCLPKEMEEIYKDFTQMLQVIHTYLDNFLNALPDKGLLTYARPKAKAFLERITLEYKRSSNGDSGRNSKFSCIGFVTSRLEVVALNAWLQAISSTLPGYNFIKCDYAIGLAATMSSKYSCITKRKAIEQYKMLGDFRKNVLNIIITTSVLEEGIDLPICSAVIRYDSPGNFRQFVQSRGRARQKVSTFITLCECIDFAKITDQLDKFNDFEYTLKVALSENGDIKDEVRKSTPYIQPPSEDLDDLYLSEDKSVRITSLIAKTILGMYCNQLSQRTPFTEGVRYERMQIGHLYQTILFLPSGCSLSKKGIAGNLKSNPNLADNSAVVASVRALMDAGEIDRNGVPTKANQRNIDSLLSTKNLEPKFEPLDKSVEGIVIVDGDRETYLYEPKVREEANYMCKDFMNRTYKLLKIGFSANREDVREETRPFMERPVFGIIVDSQASNEWIPPFLNSHYGQYEVKFMEMSDKFTIKSLADHSRYLKFTHNLLYRCLGITGLSKDQLTNHCQFYFVPLDEYNQPDAKRMQQSFFAQSGKRLQPGNIVKLNSYTSLHRDRFAKRDDRLFLVRRIRSDMNANSIIPGRRSTTFLQDAQEKYGHNAVAYNRINDPIIEVMPLSKDFGQMNVEKKSRRDYTTDSLFYINQFLDLFDTDTACVFQAYMLPEMIFRLYITLSASELDKRFQTETSRRRQTTMLIPAVASQPARELQLQAESLQDAAGDKLTTDKDAGAEHLGEHEGSDSEHSGEDEEEDSDHEDESCSSSDHEHSDEEATRIGPDYYELLSKKRLSLENNDFNDDDHLEKWDMSEYSEPNLRKQTHEHFASTNEQERAVDYSKFEGLETRVMILKNKLLNQIAAFEGRITSDENFLDESGEFEKRTAKVDRTKVPPILFDKDYKPLKQGSRERGLIEALTQRRATERYSLEGLENVGDSYLKYLVSMILYRSLDGNEGFLSAARSRLVCNEHFTYLARKSGLGSLAITSSFSKDYLAYILGKSNERNREEDRKYWNKLRPKSLADTFESVVGSYLVYHSEFEAILAIEWLGLKIFDEHTFSEMHEQAVVFSRLPTALIEGDRSDVQQFYNASKSKVRRLQEILDYKFKDPSYLVQAITHASALQKCTRSYERLEFLGDAILDYLVTMTLAKEANISDPGQMTSSRSALVNNCAFAKFAMRYKFDLFIQHGSAEIYDELIKVRNSMDEDPDMVFFDIVDFDKIVKLLGDVFESVAGAIYLDSGCSLNSVWSVYYPMMKEAIDAEIRHPTQNLTQLLHETFPGKGRIEYESYDIRTEDGDFVCVKCKIVGFGEFEGQGMSKSEAKKRAVRAAMDNAPSPEMKATLDREFIAKYSKTNDRARGNNRGRSRGGRRGGYRGGHSRTRDLRPRL